MNAIIGIRQAPHLTLDIVIFGRLASIIRNRRIPQVFEYWSGVMIYGERTLESLGSGDSFSTNRIFDD
jgi:hypothetical protein